MYENLNNRDLVQIFAETLVLYKKEPIYIKGISYENNLICETYGAKKALLLKPTDAEIDYTPVPLGMCNYEDGAVFVSRVPKRQFKQGLCYANLSVRRLDGTPDRYAQEGVMKRARTYIIDTIKGIYPSLDKAVEMIDEGRNSVAFHRYFALTQKGDVHYKTERVGLYDIASRQVIFLKGNEFLKEIL